MLSRIETTNSTSATHSYSAIPLLDDRLVTEQSQLVVTKNDTALTYVSAAPGATEYTLNKTTKVLTLGTALVATDILRIVRSTKNDAMHVVFTNLADLSAENLNLALKQLLFLDQERTDDGAENVELYTELRSVADGTYHLHIYCPFGYTINYFCTRAESGMTGTAKLTINGVDVTGSSHSVGAVGVVQPCTAANTTKIGDVVAVVITGTAGSGHLNIVVRATRRNLAP